MQAKIVSQCPKCGQAVNVVNSGHVTINVPGAGVSWNGISHTCPACHVVLGVEIDPIALKTDIVNELFEKLRA